MRRRSLTMTVAVMAGLMLGIIFAPTLGRSIASAQTIHRRPRPLHRWLRP